MYFGGYSEANQGTREALNYHPYSQPMQYIQILQYEITLQEQGSAKVIWQHNSWDSDIV